MEEDLYLVVELNNWGDGELLQSGEWGGEQIQAELKCVTEIFRGSELANGQVVLFANSYLCISLDSNESLNKVWLSAQKVFIN
jgi:hypothetical protein